MRVTQSQIYGRLAADLQKALRSTTEAQRQVATGQRFEQISGDPIAGMDALRARAGMRAVSQYRRNLGEVRTRMDTQESTISQVIDVLDNARSIAMQQGSATATSATRLSAVNELTRAMEQVTNLGNVKIGTEFIFGGNQSTTRPFTFNGTTITYAGDTAVRQAEIAEGYVIDASNNGNQLLVATGVAQGLADLRTALANDDPPAIIAADNALKSAFDNISSLLGVVGARQRALDDVGTALAASDVLLEQRESDAITIDIEKATVNLAESQQALQSALLAASKVISTNLTAYL
jgi:flagellar hook-associated protein 3 FlgL